jgi:uncharacterized protein YbbC (DUF1343 family)
MSERTLAEMTAFGQVGFWPWQGLGWELDPWSSDKTGFLPARSAFGHAGWTGTSLWMDRATGLFAILLGNTCHPRRDRRDNEVFRRVFYTGVAPAFYPGTTTAHTGLDRVIREQFDGLRGRRIALLTHHAAVDQRRRHILDVFATVPEVDLRIVYAPEHGLLGQSEAGAKVASENGRIPVISLYGDREAPSPQELGAIDLFVIDLQDVGARYYTYAATMRRCLRACAKAGKQVLILDRPNPVSGAVLEGPVAEHTGTDTCWAAVPVRHGMTFGELALFFREQERPPHRPGVSVKLLDNWQPGRLFAECSLPWIPPSPNIPTPETALLYVGMCLFEGTNLNEGRGTGTPFHLVGAPWLDAEAIIDSVAAEDGMGCRLSAVVYTPRSIPGKAASPRYLGEECRGVRMRVDDLHETRPFTLALALLRAIQDRHPGEFEWTSAFDVLAGSDDVRRRLENGERAHEIVERFGADLREFDKARPRLYA